MISILLVATTLAAAAQTVPTVYEAGHFYAVPRTTDGQTLRLMVDTGGGGQAGMYWLTEAAAQRLHLKRDTCTLDGSAVAVAIPPAYASRLGVPASIGPCAARVLVQSIAFPDDGQLGAAYFGTRVWAFDYPHRRLIAEGSDWHHDPQAHPTPLGFQKNARGKVVQYFPRVVVRIDGQPLNMLLDTGATAHPTAAGKAASGTVTKKGFGVASYITTSMFNRWHGEHPDWKVVEKGDDLFAPRFMARLIEAPKVEIAGWPVGPVWFTERPDQAFHGTMASIMDEPPEGAIGANVLSHFELTIDYPRALAWFACAGSCTK
jgi:hypothetical protein